MRRLLITGGAGFIGSHFVHYWHNKYPADRVVVLDLLTYAGNLEFLSGLEQNTLFKFVKGDICDEQLVTQLIKTEELDTIINFAAESHVDRSIENPDIFVKTNILGTHTLLKVAHKLWIEEGIFKTNHRFHHISTDEVYGTLKPKEPPFTENTPYAPNSPYSASKASSDHLVRAYHKTFGLNTTISNCSNNFGSNQNSEKLLPTVILSVLKGQPIPVYGKGENIRDWLHVEDHCKGIDIILNKGQIGETYNIGGNNEWTNIDLCKKICSIIDQLFREDRTLATQFPECPATKSTPCENLIEFVTDRPGHDLRYGICADKLASIGALNPQPFEQRLTQLIEYYTQAAS